MRALHMVPVENVVVVRQGDALFFKGRLEIIIDAEFRSPLVGGHVQDRARGYAVIVFQHGGKVAIQRHIRYKLKQDLRNDKPSGVNNVIHLPEHILAAHGGVVRFKIQMNVVAMLVKRIIEIVRRVAVPGVVNRLLRRHGRIKILVCQQKAQGRKRKGVARGHIVKVLKVLKNLGKMRIGLQLLFKNQGVELVKGQHNDVLIRGEGKLVRAVKLPVGAVVLFRDPAHHKRHRLPEYQRRADHKGNLTYLLMENKTKHRDHDKDADPDRDIDIRLRRNIMPVKGGAVQHADIPV